MAAARRSGDAPALHRNEARDPSASDDERIARAATELVIAELVRRGELPPSAFPCRDDAGAAIRSPRR